MVNRSKPLKMFWLASCEYIPLILISNCSFQLHTSSGPGEAKHKKQIVYSPFMVIMDFPMTKNRNSLMTQGRV